MFRCLNIFILQQCHNNLFTKYEDLPNSIKKKVEFLFQNNKTTILNRGKSLPSLRYLLLKMYKL